ncbi:MAG: macro domain-containing protein [Candidatus Marinimicrobia bacterium]|nr:macro domain-containing protein [Candidatus Neomarinimicrobiota bacterium]MBL7046077.1 macro domain-containing protein [Candidatus Neomarinimicrobiota bacterium]
MRNELFNPYLFEPEKLSQSQIFPFTGDITEYPIDIIVNSTNHNLISGGGVNGAINYRAGFELQQEAMKFKKIKPGQAFITKAYNLPSKYVIHTLGPKWFHGGQDEEKTLTRCYRNCMHLAAGLGARTIAFPNISTGAFNYPKEQAAIIAVATINECLSTMFNWNIHVFVVCRNEENSKCTSKAVVNYNYNKEVKNAI